MNFERRIVCRIQCLDGTEEVTLECGHSVVRVIPEPTAKYLYCAECLHNFVEEEGS
jgi:hypothetical protein